MTKIQNKKIYQKLPSKPGVYLFKAQNGKVLYIGKALNLKNRVKNHFRQKSFDIRTSKLLKKTKKVDFVTGSEIESLLLEARLIKEYRPKYNVRLKDDKRYLYVGLTKENYPAVRLIRQPEKETNFADWFGPFPSAFSLREILRLVRRIFPFRSCRKLPKSPCLYYHLKLCPGMCFQAVDNYKQTVRNIKTFLKGQINLLVKDLKKKMKQAALVQKYEEAATFKKQIQMIENLMLRFKRHPEEEKTKKQLESLRRLFVRWQGIDPVIIHRLEAYDVANLGRKIIVGAMVVFSQGEPDNSSYRQFKIKKTFKGDPEALKEILARRFNHPEWVYPQAILLDGGKAQVSSAFSALKKKDLLDQIAIIGLAKKQEKVIVPRIKNKKIISWKSLVYSPRSDVLQLLQHARDEAHRFAQRYYKKLYQKATFEVSS